MEMVADSQEDQIAILRKAQQRKLDNLEFFKEFHPAIYNRFAEFVLDDFKVSLNTDVNQLDVLYKGQSIYNNRPIAEAKEEILDFENKYGPGGQLRTINPPFNTYTGPRYFHQRCNQLVNKSPLTADRYRAYFIPDFYPLINFNGIGAGYHIEMFLEKHDVINCCIMEPEQELFACSLYIVDWKKICQPFLDHRERNVHFMIGPFEKEEFLAASLLGYMINHCPLYPLTTLFINHQNKDIYHRATDKVTKDTNAFVSTWGYYDDEVNQINNCLHNLHQKIPIVKTNKQEFLDLPIFIIGAGPSLDDRIETIKKYQDVALVVSCGTAIHTLHSHGIKPDIQFELESDQVTVTSLTELGDLDWIRSIPMMGPSQLAPRLYKLADKKVIFFKAESVTSMLFGDDDSNVQKATPTCTNGAMGIFSHWGFKRIFLFGMDFGYRDTSKHHASGSVYYKSKDPLFIADANVEPEATIEIMSVVGTPMKTKALLYTAMRSTELMAGRYAQYCTYFNCSNGAAMDNTIWIQDDNLPIPTVSPEIKKNFMDWQYNHDKVFDVSQIEEKLKVLQHNMGELSNYITEQVDEIDGSLYSFTCKINDITAFMERKIKQSVPAFYFFMRGSIWHLLYIGYSHAMALRDQSEVEKWIETWRHDMKATIADMVDHYSKVVFKEFDYDSDPWMLRSASDPE